MSQGRRKPDPSPLCNSRIRRRCERQKLWVVTNGTKKARLTCQNWQLVEGLTTLPRPGLRWGECAWQRFLCGILSQEGCDVKQKALGLLGIGFVKLCAHDGCRSRVRVQACKQTVNQKVDDHTNCVVRTLSDPLSSKAWVTVLLRLSKFLNFGSSCGCEGWIHPDSDWVGGAWQPHPTHSRQATPR